MLPSTVRNNRTKDTRTNERTNEIEARSRVSRLDATERFIRNTRFRKRATIEEAKEARARRGGHREAALFIASSRGRGGRPFRQSLETAANRGPSLSRRGRVGTRLPRKIEWNDDFTRGLEKPSSTMIGFHRAISPASLSSIRNIIFIRLRGGRRIFISWKLTNNDPSNLWNGTLYVHFVSINGTCSF